MKKVLVTGAAGLVGGGIARQLHTTGHITATYNELELQVPNLKKVKIDLRNEFEVERLFEMEFDIVVHCAARIPLSIDGAKVKETAEFNWDIDRNIVKYCEKKQTRLIYISSCSVYGLNHKTKKCEDTLVQIENEYSKEKFESEKMINASTIPFPVIFRISAPYGIGQKHDTVFKKFLENALNGDEIVYYGSGKRRQNFINVLDIGRAVKLAFNNEYVSGVFNIASNKSITMKQLAELIVRTTKSQSVIKPAGIVDVQESYNVDIDVSKAKNVLKWEPRILLEEGIKCWARHLKSKT